MRFSTLRASPRASSFSKNRDRLLTSEIAPAFLAALLALPQVKRRLSAEHFSVDGTRLKAWASMKSFRAKDGSDAPPAPGRNGERDFRKKKRSNETHASATDKDARLFRKGDGQESRLAYLGHALMENRNGLAVGAQATLATGAAEREAAAALTKDLPEGATLGADKNYDAEVFVEELKDRKIEPPIAINGSVGKLDGVRKTAVPPEVAASEGYAISMVCRKTDRGDLRLEQNRRRPRAIESARPCQGPGGLHLRPHRRQPRAAAKTAPTKGRQNCSDQGAKCVSPEGNSRK